MLRREEIGTGKHRPWWIEAVTPAATLAHEFAKSHGQRVLAHLDLMVGGASKAGVDDGRVTFQRRVVFRKR